jgi:hypothetical protein
LPILDGGKLSGYATSGAAIPSLGCSIVMAIVNVGGPLAAPRILISGTEHPLRRYGAPLPVEVTSV